MSQTRNPHGHAEGERLSVVRNMSAPPRSTITFNPYGVDATPKCGSGSNEAAKGLRWVLRAEPVAILQAHLPGTGERVNDMFTAALRQDTRPPPAVFSRIHALILAGLVVVASRLAGDEPQRTVECLEKLPPEVLQDRLTELARRLPPCPDLPAMAAAQPWSGLRLGYPSCTDPLAVLYVLTHINGRTFDRDGSPLLAEGLEEGRVYDLYTR
jgi:hypothetical protein